MRKNERSVKNIFFFLIFSYYKQGIYIHTLQYRYNPSFNYNEQYKEHNNNTSRESYHIKSTQYQL